MGKKSKQSVRDRRAKVEEMRRAQAQAERRRTMMFILVAVVVGAGLIAAAVIPPLLAARNDPGNSPPEDLGASLTHAGCTPVTNDETTGVNDHVPPGTTVDYATVPPSSGQHWDAPLPPGRKFYGPEDEAPVEQLVHNLEHGYVVVWYRKDIAPKQLEALQNLSERMPKERPKFVVAQWDDKYGEFPRRKNVAISVWGHRQLCFKASGEAVNNFSDKYPPSVAPEPTAV